MNFPKLFESMRIGSVELKNRIIFPPIATNLALVSGEISELQVFHYRLRAEGGAALIILENACIAYPEARHGATQPRIDSDEFIPGLARLARAVHDAGALISVELTHPGLNASLKFNGGSQPVAPSAIPLRKDGVLPRELNLKEIQTLVEKYAQAALRAKRAGFDMVELQGAHGLLINQFLSPLTNRRKDQYGGSRKNRLKFVVEIVKRIRELCGDRFPITIRHATDDMVEGGIDIEEGKALAQDLEEIGINMIQADLGLCPREKRLEPMPYPQGWRSYLAEALKRAVSVPVAAVGVIREPEFAERLLEQKEADFVALGRTLLADPDWPRKAQTGEVERIRKCIGCGECVKARHSEDQPIRCGVNATVGREETFARIEKTNLPKKVVVIGGGPGGMEAARVAALRGHQVTLLEKEDHLGGALNIAAAPPGKDKINWLIRYYEAELPYLGVKIRLGKQATRDTIENINPDAIVVATGSVYPAPNIPGVDLPWVVSAADVLSKKTEVRGEKVAVIGGGMMGLETALFLSSKGKNVTVLKRYKSIARNLEPIYRDYLLRELREHGVQIISEVEVSRICEGTVTVKNKKGERSDLPCDAVVLARDPVPLQTPLQALERFTAIPIGDCVRPRRIVDAIREGYVVGKSL